MIEIIYATPSEQKSFFIDFEEDLTIENAINKSNILNEYSEINLQENKVGIFGKELDLNTIVKDNSRIEIYRKLTIDPKKARMIRAEQKRKKEGINLFGA